MEFTDNETCVERGWSDTKRAWADWRFWLIEVFIGGGIAMIEPVMALLFVAGLAVAVWFGATVRAPYCQKIQARTAQKRAVDSLNEVEASKLELQSALEKSESTHLSLTERCRQLEDKNIELIEAFKRDCPIWIHEESGATIVGKSGGPIEVQGGNFPFGIKPNGSHISITGTSSVRRR